MISAQMHPEEEKRIQQLKMYDILDTLPETNFNELVELASEICQTPISLVSLIDENRQWFKAKVGLGAESTDRSLAFCAHAILQKEVFVIENSLEDERFKDNPLATGAPHVIFYAGAPLINKDGLPMGTLCAIDSKPRKISPLQIQTLKILANQVVAQMELRLHIKNQEEQLVKLEKLNQDKDRFFSIISHDLRSPFNGILGLANLVIDDFETLDKPEILAHTKDIYKSAQSAYKLVDNLLNWSLMEGGALKANIQQVSLIEVAQEVKHTLKAFAEQKKIELKVAGDWSASVLADRNMLRSTLLNLASNSIKFTSVKGKLEITAKKQDEKMIFSVSDTGIGMTPAQLEKLQKLGSCSSSLGTSGEAGSGLGLKLCFEFVEQMNSCLEVSSELNYGTKFSFAIDLA